MTLSRAAGTQNVGVIVSSWFASTVAPYAATRTMANASRPSSALRRVFGPGIRDISPVGAGVGAGTAGAVKEESPDVGSGRSVDGPARHRIGDRRAGVGGLGVR